MPADTLSIGLLGRPGNRWPETLATALGEPTSSTRAECPTVTTRCFAGKTIALQPISTPEDPLLGRVHVLVGSPADLAWAIPKAQALQWAQSTWAGIDAISHLATGDISITALKGVFGQAMSEYVLGWLLALERNIPLRHGARTWQAVTDGTVAQKRMAILGTGSIGAEIARAARALNIDSVGLNTTARATAGFVQCFATADRLACAEGAHYLVNTLPRTAATRGIVDRRLLSVLAPDAIVINVGRGSAIVEADLLAALDNGRLRHAVLDVFDTEPLPDDHPFWAHGNVSISSHSAAVTPDEAIVQVFTDNLQRWIWGEPLRYRVDAKRGY